MGVDAEYPSRVRLALALLLSLVACKTEAPDFTSSPPELAAPAPTPLSSDPLASEPSVAPSLPPVTPADPGPVLHPPRTPR